MTAIATAVEHVLVVPTLLFHEVGNFQEEKRCQRRKGRRKGGGEKVGEKRFQPRMALNESVTRWLQSS